MTVEELIERLQDFAKKHPDTLVYMNVDDDIHGTSTYGYLDVISIDKCYMYDGINCYYQFSFFIDCEV